jgi:DNA-binding beta-propeller fold protein YncE
MQSLRESLAGQTTPNPASHPETGVDPFRSGLLWVLPCLMLAFGGGCGTDPSNIGRLEGVWELRGVSPGRLQKPRAMAIDRQDRLYIVDMTARIQVFDTKTLVHGKGKFLYYWTTPAKENGRPTGLSIGRDGNVLVADTHYYRVLIYSPEEVVPPEQKRPLRIIGGTPGHGPGQFGLVRDVVQDSRGNYYVAEMGEYDRIQKFSPDGQFLLQWGSHGRGPGQFARPESLAVDEKDQIWVADACNHRIQVFDSGGKLLTMWGSEGRELGQLYYPYDLVLGDGDTVYVCEFGNNRVQKFTRDGRSLGCWGSEGRRAGQLFHPWALARDSRGMIYVLDTNNHRVQCVRM